MRFRQFNHFHEAFRKQPVISMDDFAVRAVRCDLPKCDVSILTDTDEVCVIMDADPLVFLGIGFCDFKSPISTAVIDDAILPILIGLRQYALDTLRQITLAVVNGRKYAY